MVPQVTVIGILMIINGALASLLGIFTAMMGPFMFAMFQQMPAGPGAPPQGLIDMISMIYLIVGTVVLVGGVVNIVGGIRALAYRNRVLVITALFFNIVPMLTCYCLPTSLGLMIYGLIVMFQPDVAQAFALADEGMPAEEIRQRLSAQRWRGQRFERAPDRDEPAAESQPGSESGESKAPPPPSGTPDDDRFFER
jgi:hypothetical protein